MTDPERIPVIIGVGQVNDPDEVVRAYRLGLLARFTGAVHGVADFSKIEG